MFHVEPFGFAGKRQRAVGQLGHEHLDRQRADQPDQPPDPNVVQFGFRVVHQQHPRLPAAFIQDLHLSERYRRRHEFLLSAGHATASLPQIVLELDGDDIIATGVMGLFYGHNRNPSGA